MLGRGVCTQEVVRGEIVRLVQDCFRQYSPAETPAGHTPVFRETADHNGVRVGGQDAAHITAVGFRVGQIKIGFVHDSPGVARAGCVAHALKRFEGDARAGGV